MDLISVRENEAVGFRKNIINVAKVCLVKSHLLVKIKAHSNSIV